jgi:hypothetical protein
MQRRLKAVFRSSSKKKSKDTEGSGAHTEPNSPRSKHNVRQTTSLDERRPRQSYDSYRGGAQQNAPGRPLSSNYDSRHMGNTFGTTPAAFDHAQSHSSQPVNESIASDYKAYLPVLSPVDDSHTEDYMTMGGDRRLITGESDARHEEDVADRNIGWSNHAHDTSTRKPLPATPGMCSNPSSVLRDAVEALVLKNYINGLAVLDVASQGSPDPTGSMRSSVASKSTGKYSLGADSMTAGGLVDSILPHTETSAHKKDQWKSTKWPVRAPRDEGLVERSRRSPPGSGSDDEQVQLEPNSTSHRQRLPRTANDTTIAVNRPDGVQREMEQLLDGVVDLRNTVDEDKEVKWAPGTVHRNAFVTIQYID